MAVSAIIERSCFKVPFIDRTRPLCEWVSSSVIISRVLWAEMISIIYEYVVIFIAEIAGQVTKLLIVLAGTFYFNLWPRAWLDAL